MLYEDYWEDDYILSIGQGFCLGRLMNSLSLKEYTVMYIVYPNYKKVRYILSYCFWLVAWSELYSQGVFGIMEGRYEQLLQQ